MLFRDLGGAVKIVTTLVLSPLLRRWYARWGATDAEVYRHLPGDELVPHPRLQVTRAITIHAPADEVWHWLVQIGQGRGGLYSYDGLENLAGCQIHSTDRLLPEYQVLEPGDEIHLGPDGYPLYQVTQADPNHALILLGADPKTHQPPPSTDSAAMRINWAFVLDAIDDHTTRLLVRTREDFPATLLNWLIWRVITEPIHFVMEAEMLHGLKARAENGYLLREIYGNMV